MCGFVGQLFNKDLNYSTLNKMSESLKERGPDSSGEFIDKKNQISIMHRRLSIMDLSSSGNQPMTSSNDRYVIAFNGEIYNHHSIRKDLNGNNLEEGYAWKGSSDTETLLAVIEKIGINEAIKVCVGQFAIALWDKKNKYLYLIRDRLGEKPLYYGFFKDIFYFGSDLRSFKADPYFQPKVDKESLKLYFQLNYIPAPQSIYQNIYKLQPGQILKINNNKKISITNYWNLSKSNINNDLSYDDYLKEAEKKIENSVISQTISDRPVGAFLSSGIDSSIVSFFMQKHSKEKIKTFTIGFDDKNYDESERASKIAKFLKTDHHNVMLKKNDYLEALHKINSIYSEPFSDSSQLVTYLISKESKKHVDVILSGDGGDEGFAGYNRHIILNKFLYMNKNLPITLRVLISKIIQLIPISGYDHINKFLKRFIDSKFLINNLGSRFDKIQHAITSKDLNDIYCSIILNFNKNFFTNNFLKNEQIINFLNLELENIYDVYYKDIRYYLPDDIMCKVDRASMANSLETRMPLADSNLIDFSMQIPTKFKIKNGNLKHLLKEIAYKNIPKNLFENTKKGFEVPLADLLRTTFNDWCEDNLQKHKIEEFDFLNYKEIIHTWNMHKEKKGNYHSQLWNLLIFISWHNYNS